jgi:hypothetical protein
LNQERDVDTFDRFRSILVIYGGSICEKIGVGVVVFFFFFSKQKEGQKGELSGSNSSNSFNKISISNSIKKIIIIQIFDRISNGILIFFIFSIPSIFSLEIIGGTYYVIIYTSNYK